MYLKFRNLNKLKLSINIDNLSLIWYICKVKKSRKDFMLIIPVTSFFLGSIINCFITLPEGNTGYSIGESANKSFIERTVSPWYDELRKP